MSGTTAPPVARVAEPGDIPATLTALGDWGAAVADGGTDSGVMRVPGSRPAPDAGRLDPHHTQVILVPGDTWGDESPWLSRVACAVAAGWPSVTLVVNGGDLTYGDIEHSLEARRPVIVLAGTGQTADAIADAARGGTRTRGPRG